jgi:hypothetical protein
MGEMARMMPFRATWSCIGRIKAVARLQTGSAFFCIPEESSFRTGAHAVAPENII